jgi:hypothetical protein
VTLTNGLPFGLYGTHEVLEQMPVARSRVEAEAETIGVSDAHARAQDMGDESEAVGGSVAAAAEEATVVAVRTRRRAVCRSDTEAVVEALGEVLEA